LTVQHPDGHIQNISDILKLPIASEDQIDTLKEIKRSKTIHLNETDYGVILQNNSVFKVNILTDLDTSFPVNFCYDPSPIDKDLGILLATAVLLGLYVLIIWELVHRTFAAMIASTLAIGKKVSLTDCRTDRKCIIRYPGCNG